MDLDEVLEFLELVERQFPKIRHSELIGALFPEQKKFIFDTSKRKAAICSRRAGKSFSMAVDLALTLKDEVEGDCAYIGLTRSSAKKVMFNQLLKLNKKYNLNLTPNRADLTFHDEDTGNTLYITGANTEDDAEKIRGLKLKKAVLDEVASFRAHLNYLIEEVLDPTLIDLDGQLVLIGTPSANPGENYFYKATTGAEPGFSVHKWTILNNPYIPHAKAWLDKYRERKGWGLDHPIYRREWLGEWTTDGDSLIYKYNKERNHYETLPTNKLSYIIGVDLGFDDAFACCVIGYSLELKELYVVEQIKRSGLIPSNMAEVILGLRQKYSPTRIVADTGGLGKAIVEEFNQRYQLNIKPAEKTKKAAYIELLNGDLLTGRIKIQHESELVREMQLHQWDPDRPGKEDDRTENHLADSFLYAWREAKHYLGEPKEEMPDHNSRAYWDKYQLELEKKELEQFEDDKQRLWWETI